MKKFNEWIADFGMNVIVKNKFIIYLVILAIIVFCFFGMQKVYLENSNESMFDKSEKIIVQNDKFKEIFGSEEFVFVLVESDEIFKPDTLAFIRSLSKDLEDNLPFASRITDVSNLEYIDVIDGDLYVDNLIPDEIPTSPEELDILKKKLMSKDIYVNMIISKDGKKAGILVELQAIPEFMYAKEKKDIYLMSDLYFKDEVSDSKNFIKISDPRTLIKPAMDEILKRHPSTTIKTVATGLPIVDYDTSLLVSSELGKSFLITLIVALILISFITRNLSAIFSTLIVMISTTVITLGIIGWLGIPLSIFIIVIVCMILVTAVSYSIHIFNHFNWHFKRYGNRRDAVRYSFSQFTFPCFITAVTTAIGFASFLFVPLVSIRVMGFACFLGVFVTFFLLLLIFPSFLSFGKDKKPISDKIEIIEQKDKINRFMLKWADFSTKNIKISVVLFIILLGFSIFFILQIVQDTDVIKMIGDRNQYIRDAKYVANDLGALYSYEVLIELPEDGMAKDPQVLQTVETLVNYIDKNKYTKRAISINDTLKDINMTLNNNDKSYFKVPDTKEMIAQYLLLYEIAGGENKNNWIDEKDKFIRISVQATDSTLELKSTFQEIMSIGLENLPKDSTITIVGGIPIYMRSMSALVEGQVISILIAFACITIVMMLVLGSVRVGLLSMIPNIIPIFVIGGVMGLIGILLNIKTAIVAPLIMGIAVDDTVHYFIHFKQEFKKKGDYLEANRATFSKVGWAIIFTSVILVIGFSSLAFSLIDSIVNLYILIAVGIFVALIADLFITPSLFIAIKPFQKSLTK